MGCDLDVDTEGLRGAAGLLQQAAGAFTGHPPAAPPDPPPEHAAGAAAIGREALRAALSRSDHTVQAAGMLAALAEDLARRLADAARRFDEAEVLFRGGR